MILIGSKSLGPVKILVTLAVLAQAFPDPMARLLALIMAVAAEERHLADAPAHAGRGPKMSWIVARSPDF